MKPWRELDLSSNGLFLRLAFIYLTLDRNERPHVNSDPTICFHSFQFAQNLRLEGFSCARHGNNPLKIVVYTHFRSYSRWASFRHEQKPFTRLGTIEFNWVQFSWVEFSKAEAISNNVYCCILTWKWPMEHFIYIEKNAQNYAKSSLELPKNRHSFYYSKLFITHEKEVEKKRWNEIRKDGFNTICMLAPFMGGTNTKYLKRNENWDIIIAIELKGHFNDGICSNHNEQFSERNASNFILLKMVEFKSTYFTENKLKIIENTLNQ